MGITFAFMAAVDMCPDSQIWMIGKTSSTIYDNVIRLIVEPPAPGRPDPMCLFRPFCGVFNNRRELRYKDKVISICGAKDESAVSLLAGKTMSLVYCDEMATYPQSVIEMIDTRLSLPHSKGYASMNPGHPTHILKTWIDKAADGDKNYYALQFMLEDNPFVDEEYKERIRNSLTGVYYKRNYLGLWCLAEGAVFDFFDRALHVVPRPPRAAEYFLAGIDVGHSNAFSCIVVGVNTGRAIQEDPMMWAEAEYYWDSKKTGRQKAPSEYAQDVKEFLAPYGPKHIFIDPSALGFKQELRKHGLYCFDKTNNDVQYGISCMQSWIKNERFLICKQCPNLIREIGMYVWDEKQSQKGYDEPMKQNDHAIDAVRYVLATHKPQTFDEEAYYRKQNDESRRRMDPWKRPF
jgi:PBSX family phage terminase large subunit